MWSKASLFSLQVFWTSRQYKQVGGSRYLASNLERSIYYINGEGIKEEIVEVVDSSEIEVKKDMIPCHQEVILAASIFVE